MMRKWMYLLAVGGLAALLLSAAPATLFAEEYSLDDLFRIALNRSEKLKVAEENLTLAETGTEKAYSYLLPRMTATGGLVQYSETKRTQTGSLLQPESAASWSVRVDETLSTSGRELTALEMTKKNVTKSRYDLAAIREDYLLRAVAAAYYNVLAARKGLEIADANLDRLTTYRNAAEVRLKIGEVTRTVLLRAEGELSGAKSDQLQAKNALELALFTLASNCGIKEPFTLKEAPADTGEVPPLPAYQDQAVAGRSDLKGLEVQKQIAADQIRYAEGAFWPNLSLSAVYSGADQNPVSTNLNRESLYGGVSLSFPFFEGGLRKAEVAEAKVRERQAALQYEDLKKSIDLEVRSAYLDLFTQKGILRFLEDQLAFARDNYRAVTRQFEFGLSSSLDMMDANTLLVTAERKWASALYNQQYTLLKMKKATGTLLKVNEP